jgi:hypothetical protein
MLKHPAWNAVIGLVAVVALIRAGGSQPGLLGGLCAMVGGWLVGVLAAKATMYDKGGF